jgi:pyrroloquinoline-quinone synthase
LRGFALLTLNPKPETGKKDSLMNAIEFMTALEAEINAHPFLTDPFVQRMSTPGGVTLAQARHFATLYYPHIFRTRLYQASALGIAPDEGLQYVLADIIHDEYGNGDITRTHPAVYRKFMKAVQVPEKDYDTAPRFPELVLYVDAMMRLTQTGDWLAAAAAVGIASEWPVPRLYAAFLQGLSTVPGIRPDDLELFSSHIGLDAHHSRLMRDALLPLAATADGQARIRAGVKINLDARRIMMQGLHREVFGEN